MIFLVSPTDALPKEIQAKLAVSFPLAHLPTLAGLKDHLEAIPDNQAEPSLILLDATQGQDQVEQCSQICRAAGIQGQVPLLAIIADPAHRQPVLAAGADDYLLTPLLPAEIKARLLPHLYTAIRSSNHLLEIIHEFSSFASAEHILDNYLKNLAELFQAPTAWLLLYDPNHQKLKLASSYNLPPRLRQEYLVSPEQKHHHELGANHLAQEAENAINGLNYYIDIPLKSERGLIGVLNLAYTILPPKINPAEQRILAILGQDLGILVESFRLQEEIQLHAMQNAFIVLLARTISERMPLNRLLAQTLEQAVPLLNAAGGDIWLLSTDRQQLTLVSSLSTTFINSTAAQSRPVERASNEGLIGWVADQRLPLSTNIPTDDPRFNPELDRIPALDNHCLLAVPMQHGQETIGVLSLYTENNTPFTNRDRALLEGVASLAASAIVNTRFLRELHDYAEKQRVLYEMSHRIAAGLDLQITLERALQGVSRLFDTEISLLWALEDKPLAKETDTILRLAMALGIDFPPPRPVTITLETDLRDCLTDNNQATIINQPQARPCLADLFRRKLNLVPRNMLSMPILYHGQTIGLVCLLNKSDSPFNEADLALLSTAIEIVAVAIGNARLHTQTLALMGERERLHRQVLQSERLATIGRLTASLSHEINNPMQAIRGALSLALEEMDNPDELQTYIDLSLDESERVIKLVDRMRQIYRPKGETPEDLHLNELLQEAISIARKELRRHQVAIHQELTTTLPPITAVANQLHLVFLSVILNIGDAIGSVGGGILQITSQLRPQDIQIEFSTSGVPMSRLAHMLKPGGPKTELNLSFGLSLSHEIINSHGGTIDLSQDGKQITCRLKFPLTLLKNQL